MTKRNFRLQLKQKRTILVGQKSSTAHPAAIDLNECERNVRMGIVGSLNIVNLRYLYPATDAGKLIGASKFDNYFVTGSQNCVGRTHYDDMYRMTSIERTITQICQLSTVRNIYIYILY